MFGWRENEREMRERNVFLQIWAAVTVKPLLITFKEDMFGILILDWKFLTYSIFFI